MTALCAEVEAVASEALAKAAATPAPPHGANPLKGPPPMPLLSRLCVFLAALPGGLSKAVGTAVRGASGKGTAASVEGLALNCGDWCVVADHLFVSAMPVRSHGDAGAGGGHTGAEARRGDDFHVAIAAAKVAHMRQQVLKLLFDAVDVDRRCVTRALASMTAHHVLTLLAPS